VFAAGFDQNQSAVTKLLAKIDLDANSANNQCERNHNNCEVFQYDVVETACRRIELCPSVELAQQAPWSEPRAAINHSLSLIYVKLDEINERFGMSVSRGSLVQFDHRNSLRERLP
jgi:hypothetical protein